MSFRPTFNPVISTDHREWRNPLPLKIKTMEEEKKSGVFDIKLRLIWVIIIVAVISIGAVIAVILSQPEETILENHTVSLEDQRTLLEKAEDFITDYYDMRIKEAIDNQEYAEIVLSKFSFVELEKARNEMVSVYEVESPEYIKFIHQFDKLQNQYFLEFKEVINEYCKSYEEEFRQGRITKKEFDRLNKLRDKHLKK